jgi:hypothetical protein
VARATQAGFWTTNKDKAVKADEQRARDREVDKRVDQRIRERERSDRSRRR